jgi:hypothetical protein
MVVETSPSGPGPGLGASGERSGEPIWDRPHRPTWMRMLNGVGGALGRVGVRWPGLEAETIEAAAERRAGLSDWGEGTTREGLRALVASFEAGGQAHTFGRIFFRESCIRLLVNHLRYREDLKRHPEIEDVPVRRPLIITGLPRSGTTLLHRLMSQDPAGRTLLFWEAFEPSPPPRPETRRTDPRIARARKGLATLHAVAPRIAAAHGFDAEAPEECNDLFAQRFVAAYLAFLFDVPDFFDWLAGQDLVASYREFRRQLQHLSLHVRADHWVLKAPAHLFALDAVLTAFPDACIVQTHRDPLQAVPSVCSLLAAMRGISYDRVDLRRLGAEMTEALAAGTDRALAARDAADPSRFFDVPYPALLADPVGTVRDACRHFGYAFDAEYETRLRDWIAANPQHKHGVHRYSLEQFGLDPDAVNLAFANYRRWLDDRLGMR